MTSPEERLRAYFDRIGLAEVPPLDFAGLARWQAAHRQAIPFENLEIMLGRGIAIDSDSVFDKLVTRHRGGYCFEQNRLFSDMLAAAGFSCRPLLARVQLAATADYTPPRTHTLLLVELAGDQWIVDAGFGGTSVPPMRLGDGVLAQTADGASHRLRRSSGGLAGDWVLERAGPVEATDGRFADHGDWQPQYSFDLAEVAPEDLEQGNHWTATRAGTRFTALHIVSLVLPDGFAAMTDRRLTLYRAGEVERYEIAGPEDYATVLKDRFGIDIPVEELSELSLFPKPPPPSPPPPPPRTRRGRIRSYLIWRLTEGIWPLTKDS